MSIQKNWILPEGFQEILPPQSSLLEKSRHKIIDIFHRHGYDYINPPMLEFVDSLISGSGRFLELATFKVTDQKSGKMMGVRADMTPQIARINYHYMQNNTVSRLCYFGPILQTGRNSININREQMQFGAELYSIDSVEADFEMIQLSLACLEAIHIRDITLTVGDMGVLSELIDLMHLGDSQRAEFADILMRRSVPDLQQFFNDQILDQQQYENHSWLDFWYEFLALVGNFKKTISSFKNLCLKYNIAEPKNLASFEQLMQIISAVYTDINLHVDMSLQHDYDYHTGFVYYVYHPQLNTPLIKGGRYPSHSRAMAEHGINNDKNEVKFQSSAIGFSADMYSLLALIKDNLENKEKYVYAVLEDSVVNDFDLDVLKSFYQKVKDLRLEGNQVLIGLPEEDKQSPQQNLVLGNLTHRLILQDGKWVLQEVTN